MGLKHVLRRLVRLPMFTALIVVTLGLGIGANTAIFSVIEGVLLKPLPYRQADELVVVDHSAPGVNLRTPERPRFCTSPIATRAGAFRTSACGTRDTVSVTGLAEPEEVRTLDVTDGILPMLGVQPALGRLFTQNRRLAGWRGNGHPDRPVLAGEVRRRSVGHRPDADARRPPARDHRRAARRLPVPRPEAVDRPADAASIASKTLLGQFNYRGHRAAETGRHRSRRRAPTWRA